MCADHLPRPSSLVTILLLTHSLAGAVLRHPAGQHGRVVASAVYSGDRSSEAAHESMMAWPPAGTWRPIHAKVHPSRLAGG